MLNSKNFFVFIYLVAITFFVIFIQNNDLNRDGILYLAQSYQFLNGNTENAMLLHGQIFFPKLISYISHFFNIPVLIAAKLLNFTGVIGIIFFIIKIIEELDNDNYELKNIFILFSILVNINLFDKYSAMILRDHLAWCFALASIYFLVFFYKRDKSLFFSGSTCLIAGLFRIEFFFISIIMFICEIKFLLKNKLDKKLFLILMVIFLLTLLSLFFYFFGGKTLYVFHGYFSNASNHLLYSKFGTNNLLSDFMSSNRIITYIGLAFIILIKIILAIGILKLGLIIYYFKKNNFQFKNLFYLLSIVLILIVVFRFISTFSYSSRYIMIISLILTIPFYFAIKDIYLNIKANRLNNRLLISFIIIFITISSLLIIFDKDDYKRESRKEVIEWLQRNNIQPSQVNVDDVRFFYDMDYLRFSRNNLFDTFDPSNIISEYLLIKESSLNQDVDEYYEVIRAFKNKKNITTFILYKKKV